MIELILFGLLALIAIVFFMNNAFFKNEYIRKNGGFLIDFAKYGTILLVLIILIRYAAGLYN